MDLPIIIAHRGGSLEVPENTMAAFHHAIDIGARYIETDVQLSKDGEMMVMHDETLDRTTNGHGLLRDYTFEELRKLDAGSHFSARYAGEKIPALREVVELCAQNGVGLVIELKCPHEYPGMEEKVAALVAEVSLQGAENFWCISFDHDSVRKLHKIDPALPLGYLILPNSETFVQPDDTVQAFCPYFHLPLRYPDQVAEAHRMGKYVFVYTVDKAEDMQALVDAGVDGMVTDRPSTLLKALGR